MTEMERMADKTVTQKDIRDAVAEGLQPRIQKYAEAAEKAQREVEKLAAECARLERALDDLTHKKETEEEAAARAAAEEQNAMLAHVEQDVREREAILSQLDDVKRRLAERERAQQDAVAELEGHAHAMEIKSDTLRPHLARYADTVGDAREGVGALLAALESAEAERAALAAHVDQLTADLDRAKRAASRASAASHDSDWASDRELDRLRGDTDRMRAESERLRGEVERMRGDADSARPLRAQVAELRDQVARLETERAVLAGKLDAQRLAAGRGHVEEDTEAALLGHLEKLEQVTADQQQLVAALQERQRELYRQMAPQYANYVSGLERIKGDVAGLLAQVAELAGNLAAVRAEKLAKEEEARARVAELEAALAAGGRPASQWSSDAEEVARKRAEASKQQQHGLPADKVAPYVDVTKRVQAEVGSLLEHIGALEDTLRKVNAENKETQQKTEALEEALGAMTPPVGEGPDDADRVRDLTAALQLSDADRQHLMEEVAALRARAEAHAQEVRAKVLPQLQALAAAKKAADELLDAQAARDALVTAGAEAREAEFHAALETAKAAQRQAVAAQENSAQAQEQALTELRAADERANAAEARAAAAEATAAWWTEAANAAATKAAQEAASEAAVGAALKQRLVPHLSRVAELCEVADSVVARESEQQAQREALQEHIADLQGKLDAAEAAARTAEEQRANMAAQFADLRARLDAKPKGPIANYAGQTAVVREGLEDLIARHDAMERTFDDVTAEWEAVTDGLRQQLEQAANAATKATVYAEQSANKGSASLADMRAKVEGYVGATATARAAMDELIERVQTLEQALEHTEGQRAQAERDRDAAEKERAAAEEQKHVGAASASLAAGQVRQVLSDLLARHEDAELRLERESLAHAQAREEVTQLEQKLEEERARHAAEMETRDGDRAAVARAEQLKRRMQQHAGSAGDMRADVEDLAQRYNALSHRVAALPGEIAAAEARAQQAESRAQEAEDRVTASERRATDMENRADDAAARVQQAEQQLQALKEEQAALQGRVRHYAEATGQLRGETAALVQHQEKLAQQLADANQERARLEELVNEASPAEAALKGEVSRYLRQAEELQGELEALKERHVRLEEELATAAGDRDAATAELRELQNRYAALEDQLAGALAAKERAESQLGNDVDQRKKYQQALDAVQAGLAAHVADTLARNTALQGRVSAGTAANTAKQNEMEAKVGELEEQVLRLRAKLDDAQHDADQAAELRGERDDLQERYDHLLQRNDQLQDRVDAAEARPRVSDSIHRYVNATQRVQEALADLAGDKNREAPLAGLTISAVSSAPLADTLRDAVDHQWRPQLERAKATAQGRGRGQEERAAAERVADALEQRIAEMERLLATHDAPQRMAAQDRYSPVAQKLMDGLHGVDGQLARQDRDIADRRGKVDALEAEAADLRSQRQAAGEEEDVRVVGDQLRRTEKELARQRDNLAAAVAKKQELQREKASLAARLSELAQAGDPTLEGFLPPRSSQELAEVLASETARVADLQDDVAALERDLANARADRAELQAEMRAVRAKQTAPNAAKIEAQVSEYQSRLAEARGALEALVGSGSDKLARRAQSVRASEDYAQQEREMANLREQLDLQRRQAAQDHRTTLQGFEDRISALEETLKGAQQRANALSDDKAALEKQRDNLAAELERARNRDVDVDSAVADLEARLKGAESALRAVAEERTTALAERDYLRAQLKISHKNRDALQSQLGEVRDLLDGAMHESLSVSAQVRSMSPLMSPTRSARGDWEAEESGDEAAPTVDQGPFDAALAQITRLKTTQAEWRVLSETIMSCREGIDIKSQGLRELQERYDVMAAQVASDKRAGTKGPEATRREQQRKETQRQLEDQRSSLAAVEAKLKPAQEARDTLELRRAETLRQAESLAGRVKKQAAAATTPGRGAATTPARKSANAGLRGELLAHALDAARLEVERDDLWFSEKDARRDARRGDREVAALRQDLDALRKEREAVAGQLERERRSADDWRRKHEQAAREADEAVRVKDELQRALRKAGGAEGEAAALQRDMAAFLADLTSPAPSRQKGAGAGDTGGEPQRLKDLRDELQESQRLTADLARQLDAANEETRTWRSQADKAQRLLAASGSTRGDRSMRSSANGSRVSEAPATPATPGRDRRPHMSDAEIAQLQEEHRAMKAKLSDAQKEVRALEARVWTYERPVGVSSPPAEGFSVAFDPDKESERSYAPRR